MKEKRLEKEQLDKKKIKVQELQEVKQLKELQEVEEDIVFEVHMKDMVLMSL